MRVFSRDNVLASLALALILLAVVAGKIMRPSAPPCHEGVQITFGERLSDPTTARIIVCPGTK